MFQIGTYTIEEFAKAIGKELPVVLKTKKRCEDTFLSDYVWSKDGKGKKTIYKIEGLTDETSTLIDTFYSLLECFSGQDVYFKNPETAIKVMYYLYQRNENIAVFIARDLGLAERTVRDYIKRFRKLGLLVGYWDRFIIKNDNEEKKVEKQVLSRSQYDYYQVIDGKWHETNLVGWLEAWAFRRNVYEQYVEKIESETGWYITEEQEKAAKILANKLMVEEFGEQKRVEHKFLNEDAEEYFGSFLVYAAQKLGLSFGKIEKKTKEHYKSLYQKRDARVNNENNALDFVPSEVVDVDRKYVGVFEEWYLQQEKRNEQFQIGFVNTDNKSVIESCEPFTFKTITTSHEYMKVPEYNVKEVVEAEKVDLEIIECPFTGKQEVLNPKTQKYELYREHVWVNGEKVEIHPYIVPDMPQIKLSGNFSALDEMLRSVI